MFQLCSSQFCVSSKLSFRPFVSFPVGFPNERATSRDNDILLYSPARRLAILPAKCHPRPRRAVRREAYENVIPSSRSPYCALPPQPMSFRIFRAHYASDRVYFQAWLHTFCEAMPPA